MPQTPGQLLQVTHPGGTATFSYDAVGNRLSVSGAAGAGSYSSNALNQYTSAGGLGALTYDANGNLATGGGWTYSHNSNSRLVSASGPGGASASFGRDARNREVRRTLNGVTTYHIYDEWNLVAEYNSTGTLTTRYIHGPRVDDHRRLGSLGGDCRRQPAGRDERERTSQILAKVTSSGSTYPLEDGLGSTIAVTSPTGAVLERITYTDAYGTPSFRSASGTTLPGTTTDTRFLFTGREYLAPLGLYDYRNRVYSADLGRFLQTDPIRFSAGDVNLYRYVANSPINYVDPWGLEPGYGTPGGRNLTDEQKKELFAYDDEKLDKERQDDKATKEALSDAMKDLIAAPVRPVRWVWKCVKGVLKRVWKETDPGESFPEE